jgi:hypothetical protein
MLLDGLDPSLQVLDPVLQLLVREPKQRPCLLGFMLDL